MILGSCEVHIHLDVFRFAGVGVLKWHCLCRCLLSYLHAIEAVARSNHPQHDWCALAFVFRSFDCGIIVSEIVPSIFTFFCQGVVGDSRLGEAHSPGEPCTDCTYPVEPESSSHVAPGPLARRLSSIVISAILLPRLPRLVHRCLGCLGRFATACGCLGRWCAVAWGCFRTPPLTSFALVNVVVFFVVICTMLNLSS